MSGICGVVHCDGSLVDTTVLHELTRYLDFRGPDEQSVWSLGHVGFGHALLRTTRGPAFVQQPLSLDGQTWICADARIDGQHALRQKLHSLGRTVGTGASDAELILHAYAALGEACLDHLIGDFSFALWDSGQDKLFCARDHFGVKPFFHALVENTLVFGNTLDGIRQHPAVSNCLNELAIADFLMFEDNLAPATTAFRDIQRLPPAHCLSWSVATGLRVRRYWSLPRDIAIRHRPEGDYVAQFRALLLAAIDDRSRCDSIAIEMSGGLDSTAVAALALELFSAQGNPVPMRAFTVVYDSLIKDDERRYATMAAERLGIPVSFIVADEYRFFQRFGESWMRLPEPAHSPLQAVAHDMLGQVAAHARVCLTGNDGDALLNESPKPYLREMLRQGRVLRAARGAVAYAFSERRTLPGRLWKRLRADQGGASDGSDPFPDWLNHEFSERMGLRRRWQEVQSTRAGPVHPVRPYAYASLDFISRACSFFEGFDPGVTRRRVEYRHPLMDLRLVEFCLSLPPLPWCIRKEILRQAVGGSLPGEVLLRPKTTLASEHCLELYEPSTAGLSGHFRVATPLFSRYVDGARTLPGTAVADVTDTWSSLRPVSLAYWLEASGAAPGTIQKEIHMAPDQKSEKKSYQTPVLQVYGDIRVITQNVGKMGQMDGGLITGFMMSMI